MDDVKVEADGLERRSEGTLGCGVAIATFGRTFATPDFDYLQVGFRWRKMFLESLCSRILEEVIYSSYRLSKSTHTTNSLQKGIHPQNNPRSDP